MKLAIGLLVGTMALTSMSFAEETVGEKAQVKMKSAKRATKKGVNRAAEAVCGKLTGDSKVECLAKQAKHRVEEGAEAVKDKGSEVKNKVDDK